MEISAFWDIIESARSSTGHPFDEALTDVLAARPWPDMAEFYEQFSQLRSALYRHDVWAAAYLVGGGCSDDSFIDFRAGLIAQGRDWYEQVAASPDSLAGHPAPETLFYESVNYAAPRAYERVGGSLEGFYSLLRHHSRDNDATMGEDFDFDDPAEMRRRLPRLAARCLPDPLPSPAGQPPPRRLLAR